MNKELKLFLLAVGLPAAILLLLVLRFVTLERRVPHHRPVEKRERMEMCAAGCHLPPPRRFPVRGPWSERYEGDRYRWIIAGVIGLAALSAVSGGWILMKSARKAREDALRKTDFLSNISHEFKTPLTTICLCAELARDPGLGEERRTKALDAILSESGRLKKLIMDALDFTRLEKRARVFAKEPCDLKALAAEAVEVARERFPEGISLEGDGETVEADSGAIRQILANLLDNAAKYAAKYGAVKVSVSGRTIAVADNGKGLDGASLKKVFERFWRGENDATSETGGSGLGMSIARSLARGMGGDLAVANNEGGGLTFTLSL